MIRLSSAFWLLLVSTTALATFAFKYEVQTLDGQLTDGRKATATESRELRVLDAEWAYLNRPDMLAAMNQRFLSLAPITRKQLQVSTAEIPMRPAPAPPRPAAAPPGPLDAGSGSVVTADMQPPGNPSPVVPASLDRAAAPEKLAMAASPAGSPPIRPAALPSPRLGSVDSRSLDQLIARIVAAR
jgi:hypothetical protein